ncbi:hypothetical protein B0H10DRAFT_2071477 [Mycena sp. CBHHK59/15]|nr:hypothetical protein B0H10DRAFT_2071477 [Mycena sp. CBHHK59/15]
MPEQQGLIFVYLEAGPDVKETDLNDWYDNEHAPLRVTVPGVETAIRYKATDSQTPTWLTLYDVESPETANSEAYKALRSRASDNEKTILAKIGGLSRRTYALLGTFIHPDTTAESLPSRYVVAVSLEVKPEHEDDFNKWYNQEHMDLLSKVPGWKRGRRYAIVDSNQRGELTNKPISKYLALHELDNNGFAETPEWKLALSTKWRDRVMENVVRRELRVFELLKVFRKPE